MIIIHFSQTLKTPKKIITLIISKHQIYVIIYSNIEKLIMVKKENDRYVLKNSKNPLIFSTHENKKNKTIYLLSLNEKQIQKHNSYINNINKYIAKNRKNFHSTNKSVKIKKNNRIFCTKIF